MEHSPDYAQYARILGFSEEILTERLKLMPFHLENVAEVYAKFCAANVSRLISPENPPSIAEHGVFLDQEITKQKERYANSRFMYERSSGELVGAVHIKCLLDDIPEMGIWLAPNFQQQGYGKEAYQVMIEWFHVRFPQKFVLEHSTLAQNI